MKYRHRTTGEIINVLRHNERGDFAECTDNNGKVYGLQANLFRDYEQVIEDKKPSIGSSVDTRLPRQCSLQSIWTMAMHNVQTTRQSMALSTKRHKAVQKRQSVWLMH